MSTMYRNDIDGLRAIAVLSVLFFHAGFSGFSGGFVGVDVFFVISGFLISGIIQKEIENKKFSLARFYARRAKRILPPLFMVIALTLSIGYILLLPIELKELAKEAVAALFSASNILFWKSGGYFDGPSELKPLLMTWSLGIEEQFYIFLPLLLMLLHRIARQHWIAPALLIICLASFALSISLLTSDPFSTTAFYLLPARAWELGLGVLLALVFYPQASAIQRSPLLNNTTSVLGVLLILIPVLFYNDEVSFPGLAALPPCLGAVFLLVSQNSQINKALLSHPLAVYIGKISYSLYLWHWPLFAFFRISRQAEPSIAESFFVLTLTFVLAHVSYRWIETPFRHSTTPNASLLRRYALTTSIFASLAFGIYAADGFLRHASPEIQAASSALKDRNRNSDVCGKLINGKLPDQCSQNMQSTKSILLIGDSHAAAMAPAVRKWAIQNQFNFHEMAIPGCPPLPNIKTIDHKGRIKCHADHFATDALTFADSLQGDIYILFSARLSYWGEGGYGWTERTRKIPDLIREGDRSELISNIYTKELLHKGLDQFFSSLLKKPNRKLVFLMQVPEAAGNPSTCLAAMHNPLRAKFTSSENCSPHIDEAAQIRLINSQKMTQYFSKRHQPSCIIDLAQAVKKENHLITDINGIALYRDNNHLSTKGAEKVLEKANLSPCMSM